ncbi:MULTISPECIES: GNAT family N-acetyltransferase [unclassified Shewanella]|uniref:GNAT family N-acetyltransferase n=1 Tax=unclassified Shewanella TaxID=196818 RepID=UPI001BC4CBB0|nr:MULTISPECIES: GNAT family N-acetyltransferase [unclassified Shewanella]GIU14358.1 hypothetical protein TUM4444_24030 [Shewanella sp. MBTL60-112-B1]GIU29609.1 hypothetical protein TUM4445_12050 [Shewanella sp. MBTL60-112-B2]
MTSRLELRQFSTADALGFYCLNRDPQVLKYTGDSPFENVQDAADFIRQYDQYRLNGFGRWAVYIKDTQEYIGFCGLSRARGTSDVDLGFRISREYWRNGYATEAANAAIVLASQVYGLKRLVGRVMAENLASIHTLQRVGFIPAPSQLDTEIWRHFYMELDQVAASIGDGVRIV